MDPTEPVPRGEFNACMQGIRAALADLKENMVDRTARIEGKQDAASAAALEAARESGKIDARLEALEKTQRDDGRRLEKLDLKVWGLIILALTILAKFAIGLLAAGVVR